MGFCSRNLLSDLAQPLSCVVLGKLFDLSNSPKVVLKIRCPKVVLKIRWFHVREVFSIVRTQ